MPITIKTMNTRQQLRFVVSLVAVLFAIEVINILTGRSLNQFGLVPRQTDALLGILFGPLLHGSVAHFLSNILTLGIFSFLMLQYGVARYLHVTLWILLTSGLLVWIFARPAIHVGASGLIYGYFGYLVLAGFLSRKLKLILVSLAVAVFYGGLVFGVLPSRPFVSWEWHLAGMVSGLVAAWYWAMPSPK